MRSFDGMREIEQAADRFLLFVYRNAVSAQRGDAGRLHACRACSNNHDVFHRRGFRKIEAFGHRFAVRALRAGVYAAVLVHLALFVVIEVAMQATGAGGDLVELAVLKLVGVLGIYRKGSIHKQEVDLAVGQRRLEILGRVRGVHVGNRSYGNRYSILELLCHIEHHSASGVFADQLSFPMAREVELGAVRSRTVYAVPGKVQVRSKLAYVHAQGSQSNMKAVGARRLEQFRYFQILLDGCHERAIAKVEIVFFDAVDKNLHDKIFAAFLLDSLDDLAHETRAVLERLGAVLVFAMVAHAGEERLPDIVARRIDLNRIESVVFELLSRCNGIGLDQGDFLGSHIAGNRRGERPRCILLGSAEHDTHARKLVSHIGPLFVDAVGNPLEGYLVHRLGSCIREVLVLVGAVFHPHEIDAASSEACVVIDDFIFVALGIGTGSRFDHAIRQFKRTDFHTREQRCEIRGSFGEIRILRVELRGCLPNRRRIVGSRSARRRCSRSGIRLGSAADKTASHQCAARSGKRRPLEEAPPR